MTSSPIKKIERTSYINLSDANWNQATNVWHNLPVHTPKVISKGVSTRSSPGTEQQRRRRSSSGAAWYSSQQLTPPLLSKRLVHNSYFEDQRDVDSIATSIMDVNITEIRKNSSQSLSPSPPASTTSNRKSFLSFIKARKQHHIYKRKQSMQDIDQRLGEPEDVSLADIRENGLNALLRSKVSLAFFLYHSLEEYCCENLASIQKRERENDEL